MHTPKIRSYLRAAIDRSVGLEWVDTTPTNSLPTTGESLSNHISWPDLTQLCRMTQFLPPLKRIAWRAAILTNPWLRSDRACIILTTPFNIALTVADAIAPSNVIPSVKSELHGEPQSNLTREASLFYAQEVKNYLSHSCYGSPYFFVSHS